MKLHKPVRTLQFFDYVVCRTDNYAKARKVGYDVSVLVFHFDFLALDSLLGGVNDVASKLFDAE